jgi:hypothetical protein
VPTKTSDGGGEEETGPVVIKPALSRSGSTTQKKRASRLSFGLGDDGQGGADEENAAVTTPKKLPLGQRVLENSAFKKLSQRLPVRTMDDDDRPRYSKEYLEELQSSTPNTPSNNSFRAENGEDMELDPSELADAVIVNSNELGEFGAVALNETKVLSETEIRERKERRARLAHADDFISLDDGEGDGSDIFRKKKKDSRLIREDEDLGEGFDEFVEDGGLSLGKKAERADKRRRRQQMADMILQAEGNPENESDESDAERRAAYEAAQTRAGMDGLKRPEVSQEAEELQVPPKITPLPNLTECLQRLQESLGALQVDLASKRRQVEGLKAEEEDILKREAEVQQLLNETGAKFQAAMSGSSSSGVGGGSGIASATQSPARALQGVNEFAAERGLESFGTPTHDTFHE